MTQPSLYELIGVLPTATPEEIKTAYRSKAMQYHPDRNPGDVEAEELFKAIQHAYDVLSDPVKRAEYDTTGEVNGAPDVNAVANDILMQMFLNICKAMTDGGNPLTSTHIGRTDPFNILNSQLREQARGIERNAQTNTITCERLKQILARLRSKSRPVENTPLYQALSAQISDSERRQLMIERDRELNARLLELVSDFSYQLDLDPTRPTATSTGGTLFISQTHV